MPFASRASASVSRPEPTTAAQPRPRPPAHDPASPIRSCSVPQRPDAPRRAVSLRQRLLLLAAGALLPLALAAGLALQALLDQQRQQTEQSSLDLTRALATAVDTELRLTISALQTLAATEPIASDHPVDIESVLSARRGAC